MAESSTGKRIAKNTIMLYFRQMFVLFVSLYTVRVVLNTLGIEDYGIYTVIGGLVSFFSFLSGTMASATQRFFSFALGQNDQQKLNQTFSVNIILYAIIALLAFVLLETAGLWFVNNKLNIPVERFSSALFVYHFSVFTFITTIFSAPFMAIIIAHEDMHLYALVSIIEVFLKLIIVFVLVNLPWDKLEVYGVLVLVVSFITTAIYITVCLKKYAECQFKRFFWDASLVKEIADFTGWTLFGQISGVGRNQAVTILLNQFFSPIVVSARAISLSVTNQIMVFSNNFNIGLYPSIIKSYAAGDNEELESLLINGSKITFFLMWVFALPLFLTMDVVLELWLKTPPTNAVLFTRLALCEVLLKSISLPLFTAARAPGKMMMYELSLGFIQLSIFFVSWFFLRAGAEAYVVFLIAVIANVFMFVIRLILLKFLITFNLILFLKRALIPIVVVMIVSFLPSYGLFYIINDGFFNSFIVILFSVFCSCLSMYYFGLDSYWRAKLKSMVLAKLSRRN